MVLLDNERGLLLHAQQVKVGRVADAQSGRGVGVGLENPSVGLLKVPVLVDPRLPWINDLLDGRWFEI